jgi:hypothetical protein
MIGDSLKARWRRARSGLFQTRRRRAFLRALAFSAVLAGGYFIVLVLGTVPIFGDRAWLAPRLGDTRSMAYFHDAVRKVPWSMHVVKINRARKDMELYSAMGHGTSFGMNRVSDQVKLLPPEWGRPVAAINGDLFNSQPGYLGDPEGLQIVHGELVSGPSPNRACFWIDAQGHPHRSNVVSQFTATWPDGRALPFGLNEERSRDAAVLYTTAVGSSTHAYGGLELLLERAGDSAWLPLQIGRTYTARVQEVSQTGNTPLKRDAMVLSLGPDLALRGLKVEVGTVLRIATATIPDLAGTPTAIGGGPSLVVGGRAKEWTGLNLRHPRSAIGWNQDYLFLVVVDGRQLRLSMGMTLPELADYMIRLGCQEAMNLDGGGSATCWIRGNVVNSPSQGRERPAANALVLLQTSNSAQ